MNKEKLCGLPAVTKVVAPPRMFKGNVADFGHYAVVTDAGTELGPFCRQCGARILEVLRILGGAYDAQIVSISGGNETCVQGMGKGKE